MRSFLSWVLFLLPLPWNRSRLHFLTPLVGLTDYLPSNLLAYPNQFLTLHMLTLKMEATCSSKTLVSAYKTTRSHSDDNNLKIRRSTLYLIKFRHNNMDTRSAQTWQVAGIDWLTDWLTDWLAHSSTCLLTDSLIRSIKKVLFFIYFIVIILKLTLYKRTSFNFVHESNKYECYCMVQFIIVMVHMLSCYIFCLSHNGNDNCDTDTNSMWFIPSATP
jgi:hypothetical protein